MWKHSIVLLLCGVAWAQKYDGPRPPKKDMIYLLHADNLVPTETGEANGSAATPGASGRKAQPVRVG